MLENIHGIPGRIAKLKAKLKAREGKKEYKENCEVIKAEIARLEGVTTSKAALTEFIESNVPVASGDMSGEGM